MNKDPKKPYPWPGYYEGMPIPCPGYDKAEDILAGREQATASNDVNRAEVECGHCGASFNPRCGGLEILETGNLASLLRIKIGPSFRSLYHVR